MLIQKGSLKSKDARYSKKILSHLLQENIQNTQRASKKSKNNFEEQRFKNLDDIKQIIEKSKYDFLSTHIFLKPFIWNDVLDVLSIRKNVQYLSQRYKNVFFYSSESDLLINSFLIWAWKPRKSRFFTTLPQVLKNNLFAIKAVLIYYYNHQGKNQIKLETAFKKKFDCFSMKADSGLLV